MSHNQKSEFNWILYGLLGGYERLPNTRLSRRNKWIIAGGVSAVLLITLGACIIPTAMVGMKMMKYQDMAKCRAAIAAGDTDPIAYENLAAFESAAHHDDEAMQTLRQCLKVNPNDRFAKVQLSGFLLESGKSAEATPLDEELAQSDDKWGRLARRKLHHRHVPGY